MDSNEINKVLGALLGTCLVLLSLNITAGALFSQHKPEKPGYDIVVPEHPVESGKPAEPEVPFATLLASADVARGQNSAKQCQACHTFDKGAANLVGPNLWGIVGRPKASVASFVYSPSMKSKTGTGNWTIDDLNIYLQSPNGMVPGTAMKFPGIPRASDRANVIVFLNTKSDNPAPLPKAAAAPAPAPAAQAGTTPKAAPATPAAPAAKPH